MRVGSSPLLLSSSKLLSDTWSSIDVIRPLHYLFVSMPVILRLSSIAQLAMQAEVFVPII